MSCSRILLTGLCVCGFAAASQAGPVTLNVKPGLWEITSSGQTSGAPPIPEDMLARLTPEQRAKFKAAMAASMAHASKPHVYKSCVTEKSLQRGFDPSDYSSGERCKPTVLSSSASAMDVRAECVGERRGERSSGRFHFEAPSPLTMTGTIDLTMSDGVHTMHVKRVMHGQWIAADCGKYAHND
jgi:Protein of unknown function (DUF3617)